MAKQKNVIKQKRVVSIEIGATQTRMLEIEIGKKVRHVIKAVVFDTPENTIDDGHILEPGKFAEQMVEQMMEAGIKTRDIIFTVSSNKIISREVTVTALKEKLIKNVVAAEANDYFPMDVSEYIVAHSIIGRNEAEHQYRLMVYAVSDTLLQCYYSLAEEMGCNIVSMDFVGNSMYQWLTRSTLQDVSLIMQVNETSTTVTVIDKGEMGMQRTVNSGVFTLADALIDTHCYDEATTQAAALKILQEEEFLSISEEDEERWKKRQLLRIVKDRFHRIEDLQSVDEDAAAEAVDELSVERILSNDEILHRRLNARGEVSEAARAITSKVQRVIEYYASNHPDAAISQIYITGPGIAVQGIDRLFAAELELPVEVYNVTESVEFSNDAKEFEERGAEFFACFGATVNPVGLRPEAAVVKEKKKNIAIITAGIFVAAGVVITGLVVAALIQINYEKGVKEIFEKQIANLEYIEELNRLYDASQRSIAEVSVVDDLSFSEGEQLGELIVALERALPSRALVHALTLSGDTLMLNFSTVTKEEAAKVLIQLATVPYIAEVNVAGIVESVDETTNRTEVAFTVNCILQKYDSSAENQAEGEAQ